MDLKNLQKATLIHASIKALDAEIIQIDKLAMLCANGKLTSSFELKCLEDKPEKLKMDEDGDIVKEEKSTESFMSIWMTKLYC